jgi:hypothetical protein
MPSTLMRPDLQIDVVTEVTRIGILDKGTLVVPPPGIVFSTQPKLVRGQDGNTYFMKGPDHNIVVAEVLSHLLARAVNLPVPEFSITVIGGDIFFLSKEEKVRPTENWIEQKRLSNPEVLSQTIVFDIWVANWDRNLGNFVGRILRDGDSLIRLLPIDFEKSAALRGPAPITTVPTIKPSDFWPSGRLSTLMKGTELPDDFCRTVAALKDSDLMKCVEAAKQAIEFDWNESVLNVLSSRATRIRALAHEVWQ